MRRGPGQVRRHAQSKQGTNAPPVLGGGQREGKGRTLTRLQQEVCHVYYMYLLRSLGDLGISLKEAQPRPLTGHWRPLLT